MPARRNYVLSHTAHHDSLEAIAGAAKRKRSANKAVAKWLQREPKQRFRELDDDSIRGAVARPGDRAGRKLSASDPCALAGSASSTNVVGIAILNQSKHVPVLSTQCRLHGQNPLNEPATGLASGSEPDSA